MDNTCAVVAAKKKKEANGDNIAKERSAVPPRTCNWLDDVSPFFVWFFAFVMPKDARMKRSWDFNIFMSSHCSLLQNIQYSRLKIVIHCEAIRSEDNTQPKQTLHHKYSV